MEGHGEEGGSAVKIPVVPSPWELYAGDPAALSVRLIVGGQPADLSEYEGWRAQWRTMPGATDAVDLVVDADAVADGVLAVHVAGEDTDAVTGRVRSGVWDLQATLGGDSRTFVRGSTTWRKDVTR